jgi:hypothetical protein
MHYDPFAAALPRQLAPRQGRLCGIGPSAESPPDAEGASMRDDRGQGTVVVAGVPVDVVVAVAI